MTQRERIDQLEREVADLRILVGCLRAQIAARPLPLPTPPPQVWPQPPWRPSPVIYVTGTANPPPIPDVQVLI